MVTMAPEKTPVLSSSLLKSEFRKITTVSSWWALLIPTIVLALGWSWIGTAFISLVTNGFNDNQAAQAVGARVPDLPFASFALARSINISTIFPMVLGGLAMSTEIHRKTITTTYLTAPSRVSVLLSKLTTYAALGALYGVVIVGVSSLGVWLGAVSGDHTGYLPDAGPWLAMVGAGILSTVLWTLLGVGVGALFGNVVATVTTLLLYTILAENLVALLLSPYGKVSGFLINQSADGLVSKVASEDFEASLHNVPDMVRNAVVSATELAAGAAGTYTWWIEGIIFLVWTSIFCAAGWYVSKKRDIT
jgi:ABC-2 type transport system permease protein